MRRVTHAAWVRVVFVLSIFLIGFSPGNEFRTVTAGPSTSDAPPSYTDLASQIASLQGQIAAIQSNPVLALGRYVSVSTSMINGLVAPHVILTGVNVHVRSGSGTTNGPVNGLGNLLVGYNEEPMGLAPEDRGGSHNLITGNQHSYPSYGGLVAGTINKISGQFASVSGGIDNTASDFAASLSGGIGNTASAYAASVSGEFKTPQAAMWPACVAEKATQPMGKGPP